jgi:hypothetical protein
LILLLAVLVGLLLDVCLRPSHPVDGVTMVGLLALIVLAPLAAVGPPGERIPR